MLTVNLFKPKCLSLCWCVFRRVWTFISRPPNSNHWTPIEDPDQHCNLIMVIYWFILAPKGCFGPFGPWLAGNVHVYTHVRLWKNEWLIVNRLIFPSKDENLQVHCPAVSSSRPIATDLQFFFICIFCNPTHSNNISRPKKRICRCIARWWGEHQTNIAVSAPRDSSWASRRQCN